MAAAVPAAAPSSSPTPPTPTPTPPPAPISAIPPSNRLSMMDTRTPSLLSLQRISSEDGASDSDYKPDLSAEVAMLSTKLVNAINYQTNLDDSLQQSRHELEHARHRVASLEAEKQRADEMVATGALLKKGDVDRTVTRLQDALARERHAREAAEKAKKQVEGELENLTTALFEEANQMVAAARQDTERVEKRNMQLRGQLRDTEMLLASQQEQLSDLKSQMAKLHHDAATAREFSVPSTPVTTAHATLFDAMQASPSVQSIPDDVSVEHPLHFSHLISPVLRNDLPAVIDFQDLLLLARRRGHSRNGSSSNPPGAQGASNQSLYTPAPAVSASPHLPGAFSFSSSPTAPSYGGGATTASVAPLKDSKFYKRVLTEDIEPTLRLDLAPGLSFLSRRTVLAALLHGTLAVEPYPQNRQFFACTLCGENRRGEAYARRHRFRTSEEDAVPKPLCDYCVARIRASCDFVGFLRMVREGHWKCETEEDQKSAWEESVRLRERMFWARLGGGVVPSALQLQRNAPATPNSALGGKSARPSLEDIPEGPCPLAGKAEESGGANAFHGSRPASIAGATAPPSSGAASMGSPRAERASRKDAFVTPPPSTPLRVDPHSQAADGGEAEQPLTPFEDARDQLESPAVATPTPEMPSLATALPESPSTGTSPPEVPSIEASQPEVPSTETGEPEVPSIETSQPEVPSIETSQPELPSIVTSEPDLPAAVVMEEPELPPIVTQEPPPETEQQDACGGEGAGTEVGKDAPAVGENGSFALQRPIHVTPRLSLDMEQAPTIPPERKMSSVLARVKAMEGSKQ